jgi:7-cyano-7-deazaguanine synthase
MEKNKPIILLLSGGIDSTTLLVKLKKDGYSIIAVSFDYGQKNRLELEYAKQNCHKYDVNNHTIINLDSTLFQSSALVNTETNITSYESKILPKGQVNAYVPFRNLIFISMAMSLAETMNISEVYLAFNDDDSHNFWDCKQSFIDKINALSTSNTNIQIKTPFINLSKTQVVKLAHSLNVNLENTITCYQPNEAAECGVCLSCITKQKAINNA